MKKKTYTIITLCLSMILLVSLCLIIGNYKKQKESFSSLCISEDKFNEIIKDKKQSSTPLLKELVFDGNELFFDEEDNRFYYSLVKDSTTAYNPTIEWNGLLYNIAIKDNKITDDLIHYNQDIDILIYNNNQYTISKLTCTTLPLMNVNVNIAMEEIGETYQDMHMIMFDNNGNSFTDLKGEIEIRGSTSTRYPKKSFKIKLREERNVEQSDIQIMDFPVGREYILYPGYNDPERIRNVFSTNLWYESCADDNMFNIKVGQYYKYFELFLNGKYWGLYAITYPMDETVFELDLDPDSPKYPYENFYKKSDFTIRETEVDWLVDNNYGYTLKTNQHNANAWYPLKDFYYTLTKSRNADEIINRIDIDNSIDIFMFYNLIQGVDNVSIMGNDDLYLHNIYLISKKYDSGIKILYAPWDMDRTWGNGKDGENYIFPADFNSIMYINPLFFLLNLGKNDVKQLIENKYSNLRQNEWSNQNIMNILNECEKDIFCSGAYLRDVQKWPDSAQCKDGLTVFKDYVISRLGYMDKYIEEFCTN
ncbi:MAG: CotH kinase family protein [Firmicutes bacterium]|nr:CotH kinase family protein [Candidatus Colivicinus equi]